MKTKMSIDKMNVVTAMKAFDLILESGCDDYVSEVVNDAIYKIDRRSKTNPHIGAPGGQRDLLPQCPCCNGYMEPVIGKVYECLECHSTMPRDKWDEHLQEFLDG